MIAPYVVKKRLRQPKKPKIASRRVLGVKSEIGAVARRAFLPRVTPATIVSVSTITLLMKKYMPWLDMDIMERTSASRI
jgi:hypothetical protein